MGANRARIWDVLFTSKVQSAVTAPVQELELWWAASDSGTAGTDNPGNCSGTDATYNTTPSEVKLQLLFIGSLIMSNNRGTNSQSQYLSFSPPCRYGMPVVIDTTGQTLGGSANDTTIVFIPREEVIEDSI